MNRSPSFALADRVPNHNQSEPFENVFINQATHRVLLGFRMSIKHDEWRVLMLMRRFAVTDSTSHQHHLRTQAGDVAGHAEQVPSTRIANQAAIGRRQSARRQSGRGRVVHATATQGTDDVLG